MKPVVGTLGMGELPGSATSAAACSVQPMLSCHVLEQNLRETLARIIGRDVPISLVLVDHFGN